MLRPLLVILLTPIYTILFGIPAILISLFNPGGDTVLRFGRYWARLIMATAGVRVVVTGIENLDPKKNCILIANHQSNLDVLAVVAYTPLSFKVVAKQYLWYIPVFGQCLLLLGAIPIDRKRRSKAIKSLDKAADRIRKGTPVYFFAEGTRSRDGRLLPFKKGSFVIAVRAGVPIIPVTIDGAGALFPKSSVWMRSGTVTLDFGAPIAVTGYTMETKEDLMRVVRAAILRKLGQTEAWPDMPGAVTTDPGAGGAGSRVSVPSAPAGGRSQARAPEPRAT